MIYELSFFYLHINMFNLGFVHILNYEYKHVIHKYLFILHEFHKCIETEITLEFFRFERTMLIILCQK